MYDLDSALVKFDESIDFFQKEIAGLRSGRANPALVEHLKVESYGSAMPLVQLASITAPDPKTLVIQPWDKSVVKDIEKSLLTSNLNISPIIDGEIIRLPMPSLSEDNRRSMVKLLHQQAEVARISIRHHREKIRHEIAKEQELGEISEDEKFQLYKKLDENVKTHNDKIKEITDKKDKDIMTV